MYRNLIIIIINSVTTVNNYTVKKNRKELQMYAVRSESQKYM